MKKPPADSSTPEWGCASQLPFEKPAENLIGGGAVVAVTEITQMKRSKIVPPQ